MPPTPTKTPVPAKPPTEPPAEEQAAEPEAPQVYTLVAACPPVECISVPVIVGPMLGPDMQPTGHFITESVLLQDGDSITSDMLPPWFVEKFLDGDARLTQMLYLEGQPRPNTGTGIYVTDDPTLNPQIDQAERARFARAERAGTAVVTR